VQVSPSRPKTRSSVWCPGRRLDSH
jgi:hypothetical protein